MVNKEKLSYSNSSKSRGIYINDVSTYHLAHS